MGKNDQERVSTYSRGVCIGRQKIETYVIGQLILVEMWTDDSGGSDDDDKPTADKVNQQLNKSHIKKNTSNVSSDSWKHMLVKSGGMELCYSPHS